MFSASLLNQQEEYKDSTLRVDGIVLNPYTSQFNSHCHLIWEWHKLTPA
jgi:hypothetical protein